MKFKVKFADGTIRESESLESILRGASTICTPDLSNRLKQLTCPIHKGAQISEAMVEWKKLSPEEIKLLESAGAKLSAHNKASVMLMHYQGSCEGNSCCEKLEELAEEILDQDQERGMEFFVPGEAEYL